MAEVLSTVMELPQGVVPEGACAVSARWFGSSAWVAHSVDMSEVQRRRDANCGAVASANLLGVLAALPVGVTVPHTWISPAGLRSIERAPEGAVETAFDGVTRLLVPVTVPLLAVVKAPRWTLALDRAGRFAPFCQRAIAIEDTPTDWDTLMLEAQLYGIGVFLRGEIAVPPAPFDDRRYSSQRWLLAERVFRHHLALGDVSAAKTPTV